MPFSFSGRIAQGADEALEQVLDRRMKEQIRQDNEKQRAADLVMRQQAQDLQRQQMQQSLEGQRINQGMAQKRFDLDDLVRRDALTEKQTNRNRASDMAGVLAMPGMENADKIREISGIGMRAGTVDPEKVIANLMPLKQTMHPYVYTDPKSGMKETRFYDQNNPPSNLDMGNEPPKPKDPQEAPITLTPAGLDMAALTYRKTGQMPTLGMGDRGNRQNIINRAASLTNADIVRIESNADIAGNKQDYMANTGALTSLQKQRDSVGAFEQTASKNIDVFLKQAEKVVDTGSPLANTLLREVSGTLLGNKDQAAYEAARQVAINEIAKITTSPTMAGQLSDTARKEVASFSPANATLGQTVAVMRLLKAEMNNRITALDDQLKEIRQRGKAQGGAGGSGGTDKQETPQERYQRLMREP